MTGSDERYNAAGRVRRSAYEAEMERLQEQLVLLQYWIQSQGLKVLVIFEGRGSAGTSSTCPPPARWCCSTAAGTTARTSSG